MADLINYLNNPYLVASFQKIFGVESQFDGNNEFSLSMVDIVGKSLKSHKIRSKTDTNSFSNNVNQNSKRHSNSNSTKENIDTQLIESDMTASKQTRKQPDLSFHELKSSNGKTKTMRTDHSNIIAETTINNRFWYYFFHLGAAMGNEIFYCIFFPFWFWNVDGAIARKVAILWGIFMYVGQASKDFFCMPRPASPPVVKLEEKYITEYGFPSTHAMVSAGLPISLVYLSYNRYNIDLFASIALATVFCLWICSSRLYLGMHSLLDVIAGVIYAVLILLLSLPVLEPIDEFIITNRFSSIIAVFIGFALCYFYPSLRQWSTARGDTTIIIGTVVGFSIGSFFNNYFGFLNKPGLPPLYDIHFPTRIGYIHGIIRSIIGLIILITTRHAFKTSLLQLLCRYYGLDSKDSAVIKQKKIELPYYYLTYIALGINVAFTSPILFRWLNIQRDYSYTEL